MRKKRKVNSGQGSCGIRTGEATPRNCVARQVELKLPSCVYTDPVFVLREADYSSVTTHRVKNGHFVLLESLSWSE